MAKRPRSRPIPAGRAARRKPSDPRTGPRSGALVDEASPRLAAAQRLSQQGRPDEAQSLLDEAVRQEPNNVRAYVLAARAHAQAFRFGAMERLHQRLIERAPEHPGVHHYLGETFAQLKLPARATACFETAARLPGALPPTWMELASLYEGAHRLDEASLLIERAVQAGFDLPLLWLVRGRIQRRRGELSESEGTFHALIRRAPESEWAAQAWGELALMRDQAGDFEGAAAAIDRCKQLQRAHEAPFWNASEQAHARVRQFIDQVSSDHFRRWRREAAESPGPPLGLLTGFPRSGTTLLEQLLDAHPGLVSSEERDFVGRELFGRVTRGQGVTPLLELLERLSPEQLGEGRARYLPAMEYLLGAPIAGRVHLDKNPAYNLTIPVMLRYFPETSLIVAQRDPRDVVLSCYLRHLPLNTVSVRFLTIERAAERYALDMGAWLKFRGLIETPWCEVRYEDTVADPEREARRALGTLGLDWSPEVLDYRARLGRDKLVTSPTYEAVAAPIHRGAIGRWRNYQSLLEPALDRLQPFVRALGYD